MILAKAAEMKQFQHKPRKRYRNSWFNDECLFCKKQVRKAYASLKTSGYSDAAFKSLRDFKKKYRVIIKRCKKIYELELQTRLANVKSCKAFWETVKEFRRYTAPPIQRHELARLGRIFCRPVPINTRWSFPAYQSVFSAGTWCWDFLGGIAGRTGPPEKQQGPWYWWYHARPLVFGV